MLARFVCPASRLPELEQPARRRPSRAVSAVLDGGDWATSPLPVEAVEMVGPPDFEPTGRALLRGPARRRLARHARRRRRRGARAAPPLRRKAYVPTVEEVPAFFAAARDLELPFKATAGLHHPVRSEDEHGFLNFLTAADRAAAGADEAERPRILATTDASELGTGSARGRAVRLDRLLLVRRAGRGPPGWGCCEPRARRLPRRPAAPARRRPRRRPRARPRRRRPGRARPARRLNPLMAAGPRCGRRSARSTTRPTSGSATSSCTCRSRSPTTSTSTRRWSTPPTSAGSLRPDAEPLLPNWRHLPVGYHGRAGTVVPAARRSSARAASRAARRRRAALRPQPPASTSSSSSAS